MEIEKEPGANSPDHDPFAEAPPDVLAPLKSDFWLYLIIIGILVLGVLTWTIIQYFRFKP